MLATDRAALARFVSWLAEARAWSLSVLFTPYGEALVWPAYREALVTLSHLSHVRQVSIQTNASGPMDFLDRADRARVSLWISWHPTEIAREAFVEKINQLHQRGVRLSVGAVALPEHLEAIEALRAELPAVVPMWINAQKPGPRYDEAARARWRAIDPAFDLEARRHLTRGEACLTGVDTLSVDGDGEIRRCHFVETRLGNLYADDLTTILKPRPCPRLACDCWIGYANLPSLEVRRTFADDGLWARIRR
jgi:MoaA/NifB/PqqE/SkfB family radical SAM enzyme